MRAINAFAAAFFTASLSLTIPVLGQPAGIHSPVDHSQPMETLKNDFGLVDGAAANGNLLYVPDVKAKKLYAYRVNNSQQPWQVVVENQGGFSGTFFQLGELYIADNPGGRILKLQGLGQPQPWAKFSDGARPNDLVVDHLGNAFVTLTKEGEIRRIAADGTITTVANGIETPNGITLSPDSRTLYVSAYKPGIVMQANVLGDQLGELTEFAKLEPGENGALADGMGMDRAGNVYCTGADSVWIWNADGELLDKITTPERPINCTFGGPQGMDLFISTFGGIVRQRMNAYGMQPNPAMEGARANPPNQPSTEINESVAAQLNQVYYTEGTRKLLFDLFTPNSDEAGFPALVLVHGGGWLHGDKTKFRPLALKLAARGFVVMAIEYRLGHEAHFPAAIHDCNAAVQFLRSNATALNIDPDRIAAVGGSAGGHLVGLMATGADDPNLKPPGMVTLLSDSGSVASSSSHLKAAVVMAGPMQIASGSVASRSANGMTSNATDWLGASLDDAPEVYHLADAYEKISAGDPPILFVSGSKDNPDRDRPSLQKLKSVGVKSRQVIHEGATHGHWNRMDTMDQVVDDIAAFLTEHL